MATRAAGCDSSRRFRGTAAYYLAGRPPYAKLLIWRVAALTGSRNSTPCRMVDRAFSMSSTAPAHLGARAEDLERDIRALIREIAPDGRLTEVIVSSALIGRRPGEETMP